MALTFTKDQVASYAVGSGAMGGGVATSDHTLIDWLTFQVLQAMDMWTLMDWFSAIAVVFGAVGVLFRIYLDATNSIRARHRHRLEMEVLEARLKKLEGD